MIDPKTFKFHVFLDSDGVFYDFEGYFIKRCGKPWNAVHPDWAWEQIDKDPHWYAQLPLLPHARELWEVVAPFTPTVLTGCPRYPYFHHAEAAKRMAWERDFGVKGERLIACLSKDKFKHMAQPGDIIIDDHMRNVRDWRKNGGTAILFQNHAQAVEEFKRTIEALSVL